VPKAIRRHQTNGLGPLEKASRRKEEEAPVSAEESNKALVRHFFDEVYNRGNLDIADELLSPDYVDHTAPCW
jgi:hypothetical protein